MKKIIYVVLFAVMALFAQNVKAQPRENTSKDEAKAKSEALMNTRLEMIKDELELTDAQFAAFEPVYREYRKVLGRVSDKGARVKKEDLTNVNVLKVMSIRLSNTINAASVKQKYLWIINLSGAILNICLNAFMIPLWGASGAAFASMLTQFFANFVLGFVLKPLRENNRFMINGIRPKYLFKEVKVIIKEIKRK